MHEKWVLTNPSDWQLLMRFTYAFLSALVGGFQVCLGERRGIPGTRRVARVNVQCER